MAIYKFEDNNVFINTLEANPEVKFLIVDGNVFIDDMPSLSGENTGSLLCVEQGNISLYEMNIDRDGTNVKHIEFNLPVDGHKTSLRAISNNEYNVLYEVGAGLTGSYNLSSSISYYYYNEQAASNAGEGETGVFLLEPNGVVKKPAVTNGRVINGYKSFIPEESVLFGSTAGFPVTFSLKNAIEKYSFLSPHFNFLKSPTEQLPYKDRNLTRVEMGLINIPSIFYGSAIKKGSVRLNYYFSGSLIGTLTDEAKRGELRQSFPLEHSESGSVAGLVLYNEGLIILTGSYQLENDDGIPYIDHEAVETGHTIHKWTHFGSGVGNFEDSTKSGISNIDRLKQVSFSIDFQGTTVTPTITMLCNAPYSNLNWSNNPTFMNHVAGSKLGTFMSSDRSFKEYDLKTYNATDTELVDYTPEQKKETYISKVAIYDEKKNLIGIAKLANPVRKTPDRSYLFKLKLDL